MNKNLFSKMTLLCLLILMTAGCTVKDKNLPQISGGFITGANLQETNPGTRNSFDIPIEKEGDSIGIDFRGTVTQGNIRIQIVNASGDPVFEKTTGSGVFMINEVIQLPAGQYKMLLAWDEPVQAAYGLFWRPDQVEIPQIQPIALFPGIGMLMVGIGFSFYALSRHLGIKYLLFGSLAWVITVALKFAWAIPINPIIYQFTEQNLPAHLSGVLFNIYVGSLTGFFEVGITWLILRYIKLGKASWKQALSFGIGFGSIEAILLGISPLISVVSALSMPNQFPLNVLESLALYNQFLFGLAPVVERFFTILIHIFSNVLIFYAVARHESRWMWYAFLFKTGIDSVAAAAQMSGNLQSTTFIWMIEAVVILFGIAGWLGTRRVRERYPTLETETPPTTTNPV